MGRKASAKSTCGARLGWITTLLGAVCCLGSACRHDDARVIVVGSVERTLVELSAPATETIAAILVTRGQHVGAGTLIARLDATVADAEVARTVATVAAARGAEAVAAHDLARAHDLRRKRVAAAQDLERAQLASDEAIARRREAESAQAVAEKRRSDLELRAPAAGTVDQIPFDVGERVPHGAVLIVLERDDTPWVRTWIPERAVMRLPPGSPAEIRLDGGQPPLSGCLEHVAREPEFTPHYSLTERERAHLVYEARIALGDDARELRTGSPATVVFILPPDSAAVSTGTSACPR
jgi:HlyD family secretion protein